jgi:branched-chain amino acid transport system permease protein
VRTLLERLGAGRLRFLVAVIALAGAFVLPLVLESRFTVKVLTFTGINVIIVVGLALLFGYAGQISLGHAGFYGLGAYTSAILTTTFELPWVIGLVVGTAVAALGGLILAVPSLKLKGHYLAMATLGFGEIVRIVFVQLRDVTGGPDGFSGIPPVSVGSFVLDSAEADFTLVWAVAIVALLLAANLGGMRPGRAMKAIHGSELGASACGVDISRMKITVFTISAAMAGLAGVLYAHTVGFISPSTFSLNLSIILVAMVVLGGPGSLAGAVAGTVFLSLLPFSDAVIPGIPREVVEVIQDWEHDLYGLTIILVMLFLPRGLAGGVRSLLSRFERRRPKAGGEAA